MEGTVTFKPERQGKHQPAPDVPPSTDFEPDVEADRPGTPLFLQRAALSPRGVVQRQSEAEEEEEEQDEVLQAQLAVSRPGDRYEDEADRVAEQVLQTGQASSIQPISAEYEDALHRQTADEEEKKAEEREKAHRLFPKLEPGRKPPASTAVESQLQSTKHDGQPLPTALRAFFEPRFGRDFSQVHLHTQTSAEELNESLHAQAFTHGRDIYFNQGQFAPQSHAGRRLLAHELTHVVQQDAAPTPGGTIQRQGTPAADASTATDTAAGASSRANQSFAFSEEEMEQRLSSTPTEGADTSGPDVAPQSGTESKLSEVEGKSGAETQAEGKGTEGAGAEGKGEGAQRAGAGEGGEGGAPPMPAMMPEPSEEIPPEGGSAAAFEGLVNEQVAAYLAGNVSDERLSQLDPVTRQLLEGTTALEQQPISEPEGSALGTLTGLTPLALTRTPPGYKGEEPWVQVVAQIRDITGSLGGVVGNIGLIATVSGFILSLLIPPVGAFLLTVGRFCDIAALVLDAVSLVCGIILTSYHLYRLKNATNPEEKRRLLEVVRQDALNTVMSGISVATAIAPGAARSLGGTRLGKAAGRRLSNLATGAGRRMAAAGTSIGRSGFGQAVARSVVGRGAAQLGRGAAWLGRGAAGLGRRGVARAQALLVKLRGTGPVRWANRVTGRLEDRARNYFRTLAMRNTRVGRFYNRRLRGFHERNVMTARMLNDPIDRAYHMQLGQQMRDYLDNLQRQGVTDINALTTRIRQEFGDRAGDFQLGRKRGQIGFARDDSAILRQVREHEFTEMQLIRDLYPNATPAQLAAHVNRSPFIKGQWNADEVRAFLNMHPGVRQPGGQLVTGAVPKTPHHTIPAQMAPQIATDPRFMQIVNDDRSYPNFINQAYPGVQRLPDPRTVRVPGGRPGGTRQAGNLQEATQGMVDQGTFTVPNRNFFTSGNNNQFLEELRAQGSSGIWINPRNSSERYFFNPHLVIGHDWDWEREVARQIFDMNTRLGLHGEPVRQLLLPALRQMPRSARSIMNEGEQPAQPGMTSETGNLIDDAVMAGRLRRDGTPLSQVSPLSLVLPPQTMPGSAAPGIPQLRAEPQPATSPPGGMGGSDAFVSVLSTAMVRPVVTFANMSATVAPEAGVPTAGAGGVPANPAPASMLEPPPTPVLYSPQTLAQVQDEHLSIEAAIQAVQGYIAATQQSEYDNRRALQAAGALKRRTAEQQGAVQTERADVAGQQNNLTQAEGAQQTMTQENERASHESSRGKSQGESVQGEGANVTVEAKPEEPRKRSWLERAWDATVGAVWDRLIAPAIRLVRRKVNQVLERISRFIMDMINQALGLDKIEAELNAGSQDIQGRHGSLQETDTGLQETTATAEEEAARNEASLTQAQGNIEQAQTIRADAEILLAELMAYRDFLQQEKDAGIAYIVNFHTQYGAYFLQQQTLSQQMAVPSSASASASLDKSAAAEDTLAPGHVLPIVSYITALERSEAVATQEVNEMATASGSAITPEMRTEERTSTALAVGIFQAEQTGRLARLTALRTQAEGCVGMPQEAGFARLQSIMDEVLVLADALEAGRQIALQTISEPHLSAAVGGEENA